MGLLFFPAFQRAAAQSLRPTDWRQQALMAEKRGDFLQACRCYDEVLRKDRNNAVAREGYLRCLRRLHLVARHSDSAYRQTLAKLDEKKALLACKQVLLALASYFPDRARTDPTLLFQQGLHEARLAMDDPVFRKHYLRGVKLSAINAFRARLADWPIPRMTRAAEAVEEIWNVLRQAARDGLPTRSVFGSALALEFAAGACNSLDEHSSFLTPAALAPVPSGPKRISGVGLEVALINDKLQVTRVYRKGPAEESPLVVGDQILRIGGVSVEGLPSDAAADRLRGEPGSVVEIEFLPGDAKRGGKQIARLKRRPVVLPSVEPAEFRALDDSTPVVYLRINYFTDSTLQEVREELLRAGSMGEIKGLILDLRGNPGGAFTSAVAVAELFLSGSVIVIGQSPRPEFNRTFKSDAPAAFGFPIVILIDGETASAAEVLAAALKESRAAGSARLVGQPTFGKGSIQCLIQLRNAPLDKMAGIRLTVARLFSPSNQPLTGKGLAPDVVARSESDILALARKELQRMITGEPAPAPGAVAMAEAKPSGPM
jgi:carboxyl-terminal processing protease